MFFNHLHHVVLLAMGWNTLAARFNESDNIMDVELIYTTPMSGSQPTQHLSVWNKFMAAKVAPNIIPVPPYEGCRVIFANNTEADFGNTISMDIISKAPEIRFDGKRDKFYCIYMTGIRYFPNYTYHLRGMKTTWKKPPKWEWHQMIIGNIPGNRVKSGDILWPYMEIEKPYHIYSHEYVVLIYQQHRRMKFTEKIKGQEWNSKYFRTYPFAVHHALGDPRYGNFFKQGP